MIEKIKILVKLQELDIILKEAQIVHGDGKDTNVLEAKVTSLRKDIDGNTLSRYDRLVRQGVAVVQEMNGMCLGCNLSIPIGDLNRIQSQKIDPICPNCGKFLVTTQVRDAMISESASEKECICPGK